jgi:hypothetical protein
MSLEGNAVVAKPSMLLILSEELEDIAFEVHELSLRGFLVLSQIGYDEAVVG